MRDVAKVVKKRLNEEDEQTNSSKRVLKFSEIPFDYLLNPEFNEDLVRDFPNIFKLNEKGDIGIVIYDAEKKEPIIRIYEENSAFLFAKVIFLITLTRHVFTIKGCGYLIDIRENSNEFRSFVKRYADKTKKYKINLEFSVLSISSNTTIKEKAKIIINALHELDKYCPISKVL